MRGFIFICLILLSLTGFSQYSHLFEWDDYVVCPYGGTFNNADSTILTVKVDSFANCLQNGGNLFTGINDQKSTGIIHRYQFDFSQTVDIRMTIFELNKSACYHDRLTFNGSPKFDTSFSSGVEINGNVVDPLFKDPLMGTIRFEYFGITTFTIFHGRTFGCNPGFIIIEPFEFNIRPVGIESHGPEKLLNNVNPNPTMGHTTLVLNKVQPEIKIELLDTRGRLLDSWTRYNTKEAEITIKEPGGLYLLRVSTAKSQSVHKIVKQ